MMDCKKALTETNGNLDEAVDYLRKKAALSRPQRERVEPPRKAGLALTFI